MKSFAVPTQSSEQWIDITERVRASLAELEASPVQAVLVYCPHTTAGVTINECADPDVATDLGDAFSKIVPEDIAWRHGEGNSPAHLKAGLVGSSVTIPVLEGQLKLGRWQGIFLCEFDGPRTREIWVQALS